MGASKASLVIVLSTTGDPLDLAAVRDVPVAHPVRAEVFAGENVTCVTMTLHHACETSALRRTLRRWAGRHGWRITVAPLNEAR